MSKEPANSTVYKGDFLWPYLAPMKVKPGKPPEEISLFLEEKSESPLDRNLCHCERHNWSPHYKRAKHLKEKERAYREAMIQVASERAILENEIIQHPCADVDESLVSLYGTDYAKRAFPMADYRTMKKDHDDPIVTPVAMMKDPSKGSYRDVSTFKTIAISPPNILGPRGISFNLAPATFDSDSLYTSEYSARISKQGFSNLQTSQRFR
ncbi:uncharacterized protein [Halyomorpha halys]|uniref:uncharacterized protein n=1 Tax=Halyomorpha halys TaxID=286706 RepID=UPI0006D4F968|nr:uncharacterized protein LOC106682424 [Halyomorpha halys]